MDEEILLMPSNQHRTARLQDPVVPFYFKILVKLIYLWKL